MRIKIDWPSPSSPATVYCPKCQADVSTSTCTQTKTTINDDGIRCTDWECSFFGNIETGYIVCIYDPAEGGMKESVDAVGDRFDKIDF